MPPAQKSKEALLPAQGADARARRKAVLAGQRREHIVAAARTVFAEEGLERATMRRIADACGYTPAAIYFYFEGKEEIYAAILQQVLEELRDRILSGIEAGGGAEEVARRALNAFFDYYRERPREFELSYYLFGGVQPRGLTSKLNRKLNHLLKEMLESLADALAELGPSSGELRWQEAVAALAHLSGIVLLENSGRLKTLRVDAGVLQSAYIDELIARQERA